MFKKSVLMESYWTTLSQFSWFRLIKQYSLLIGSYFTGPTTLLRLNRTVCGPWTKMSSTPLIQTRWSSAAGEENLGNRIWYEENEQNKRNSRDSTTGTWGLSSTRAQSASYGTSRRHRHPDNPAAGNTPHTVRRLHSWTLRPAGEFPPRNTTTQSFRNKTSLFPPSVTAGFLI